MKEIIINNFNTTDASKNLIKKFPDATVIVVRRRGKYEKFIIKNSEKLSKERLTEIETYIKNTYTQ